MRKILVFVLLVFVLTACGGGGGSDDVVVEPIEQSQSCVDLLVHDPRCYPMPASWGGGETCSYVVTNQGFYVVHFEPEELSKYHEGMVVGNSCAGIYEQFK